MNSICINYQSKKKKKIPILVGGGSIPFILFCSQNNYVLLKILYNEKILDIKKHMYTTTNSNHQGASPPSPPRKHPIVTI